MTENDMSSSSIFMCDECGLEESASNEKVCTSCEQTHCKSSVDDNSLCGDEDNDTNDTSSNKNDSSDGNTKDDVVKFKAGDHITLQCNAAGIPYNHHAIVLSTRSDGEGTLCVADFTAGDAGKSAFAFVLSCEFKYLSS